MSLDFAETLRWLQADGDADARVVDADGCGDGAPGFLRTENVRCRGRAFSPAELEGEEEEQGMGETGQDWFNTQSGNLMGTGHHTRDIGEGGWQEMMDPQSGQTYYQHAETGETKWSLTPREAAGKASKRASQPQRRASTAHLG